MSNETDTSNSMYHLMYYKGWNEAQTSNYETQNASSNAVNMAFIVAVTQYVVTMWVLELWQGNKLTPDSSTTTSSRPQPYWVTSTLLFWIVYTLLLNDTLYNFVDGTPIGYKIAMPILVFGGVFLHLFVDWAFTKIVNTSTSTTIHTIDEHEDNDNDMDIDIIVSDKHALQVDEDAPLAISHSLQATTILQPKPKLHYINNIKIFLTNIVILHHIAMLVGGGYTLWGVPVIQTEHPLSEYPLSNWGWDALNLFITTNAAYFMQLFFFFSGFFVPKSFDKKGSVVFLQERIKRLGIPSVVYSFLIGPYIQIGFGYLFFNKEYWLADKFVSALPLVNTGVTWFPQILIFFNIIYAFACKKNWTPMMKCPTVFGFVLLSLMIGTVSGIINLFLPGNRSFFGVSQFGYDYFSLILFFFGGAIAQRNNWMDDIQEKRSRIAIYSWMVLAFLFVIWNFVLFPILGYPTAFTDYPSLQLIGFAVYKGPVQMGLSLGITVFFMDYVNRSYWCTQFFSVSMYTAYIIQPAVITFTQWIWILVLQATNNVTIASQAFYYNNGNLILPGFIFESMLTLILIWPLSYGIRSIPGFSKVL